MDLEDKQNNHEYKPWWGWTVMKKHLPIALLVLFTFTAGIFIVFLLFRSSDIADFFTKLFTALRPVFVGLIWGYLLNPVMRRIEYFFDRIFLPRTLNYQKTFGRVRMLSAVVTVLISVVFIVLICVMLVPAIVTSGKTFVDNFYVNVDSLITWLRGFDIIRNTIPSDVDTAIKTGGGTIVEWLKTYVFDEVGKYAATLTGSVFGVIKVVVDFLIGIIVAIYVLNEKNRFEGQAKKIIYAAMPVRPANLVVEILHKCNEIFSGFIVGKVIDSVMIGLICFVVCSIVRMPYTPIVSVVVGVTNIIPFFGPFIGAIPSFILIVFTDPLYGLYFLIFILVLQQIDGNIIGPKILGDSTGLSSFWVITSILGGGSMFGFIGMLFGVPVFASIYYIVKRIVDYHISEKDLKVSSLEFTYVEQVDQETGAFVYDEKRRKREEELMNCVGRKRRFQKKASQKRKPKS